MPTIGILPEAIIALPRIETLDTPHLVLWKLWESRRRDSGEIGSDQFTSSSDSRLTSRPFHVIWFALTGSSSSELEDACSTYTSCAMTSSQELSLTPDIRIETGGRPYLHVAHATKAVRIEMETPRHLSMPMLKPARVYAALYTELDNSR